MLLVVLAIRPGHQSFHGQHPYTIHHAGQDVQVIGGALQPSILLVDAQHGHEVDQATAKAIAVTVLEEDKIQTNVQHQLKPFYFG